MCIHIYNFIHIYIYIYTPCSRGPCTHPEFPVASGEGTPGVEPWPGVSGPGLGPKLAQRCTRSVETKAAPSKRQGEPTQALFFGGALGCPMASPCQFAIKMPGFLPKTLHVLTWKPFLNLSRNLLVGHPFWGSMSIRGREHSSAGFVQSSNARSPGRLRNGITGICPKTAMTGATTTH